MADDNLYIKTDDNSKVFNYAPPTTLSFGSPITHKTANIDFSGDSIKYSGDMPVEESARAFFDAVFAIYKKEIGTTK